MREFSFIEWAYKNYFVIKKHFLLKDNYPLYLYHDDYGKKYYFQKTKWQNISLAYHHCILYSDVHTEGRKCKYTVIYLLGTCKSECIT